MYFLSTIVLAIIISFLVYEVDACPKECKCDKTIVKCLFGSFTTVPSGIPADTTELEIGVNQNFRAFELAAALTSLRKLSVYSTALTRFDASVLSTSPLLEELVLTENRIKEVDLKGFLQNLESLDLSSNELGKFQAKIHYDKLPNLESLNLDTNLLQSVDFSSGLPNLKRLTLFSNKLTYLESNQFNLPKLEKLNLSNNELSAVSLEAIKSSRSLELDLTKNSLMCVDITNIPDANSVILLDNQLTGINLTSFRNLKKLSIVNNRVKNILYTQGDLAAWTNVEIDATGNPLACGCYLLNLGSSVTITGNCASPPEVYEKSVSLAHGVLQNCSFISTCERDPHCQAQQNKVCSACLVHPCQNGGNCTISGNGYFMCACPSGYTGAQCAERTGTKNGATGKTSFNGFGAWSVIIYSLAVQYRFSK